MVTAHFAPALFSGVQQAGALHNHAFPQEKDKAMCQTPRQRKYLNCEGSLHWALPEGSQFGDETDMVIEATQSWAKCPNMVPEG